MNARRALSIVALIALSLSAGCSSLKSPTTALRSANLGEVTADGVDVNFAVDFSNPNSIAIPLTNTAYNLRLGKSKVLDGEFDADASIPANGTQSLTVPIHVTFDQLLSAAQAVRASGGDIPYTLDGSFRFGANGSKLGIPLSVPFEYNGELPLKKLLSDPAVLLKNPAARRLAQEMIGGYFGK